MPSTYTRIQNWTLASSETSFTLTDIPQSYSDLVLVISGSQTTGEGAFLIRVGNGSIDTGSNYTYGYMYSTGSSVGFDRVSNTTAGSAGRADTTNGAAIIHINNYSGTNGYKTILNQAGNGTPTLIQISVSTWKSTSAINQIRLTSEVGGASLSSGFKLTLYGILRA